MPELFSIDKRRFNDDRYINARTAVVPFAERGHLLTALTFLYRDDGPVNLPLQRRKTAEPYLDDAERIVVRWLHTRCNGKLRKSYGAAALRAARSSRYRCKDCGFADARALNLDHVDGRVTGTSFVCVCANCHAIKSRKFDWTGKARDVPWKLSTQSS